MGRMETFVYRDNTGGSNLRSNEMNINQSPQGTEMVYIQNMESYRRGGFTTQKGNVQLNTGVTDATAILGIAEFKTNAGVYAVYGKASGKYYCMAASGGAETQVATGKSTSATPAFVNYGGKIGVFNGVDTPFFCTTSSSTVVATPPSDWTTTKPHTVANLRGGRMLAAAGSTIYWNKQGDETNWTAASDAGQVTEPFQDVANINALANYGSSVSIHSGSNRIQIFTGNTFDSYAITPMASNRSSRGKYGVATINDNQFFFSGESIQPIVTTDLGVVKLGKDIEISDKISPFFSDTERDLPINLIDRSSMDDTILLPYDKKNELIGYFKTTASDGTYYDLAAIFNFNMGSWVFRKATPVTAAGAVNGKILTGTSDGKILEEFSGDSIVGSTSFAKKIIFPFFDFGAPHVKKRVLKFHIWAKSSTTVSLLLRWKLDYDSAYTNSLEREITFNNVSTAAAYGYGAYGFGTYASSSVVIENFPTNATAESFQPELTSSNPELEFRIIGYAFEVEYLDSK